MQLNSIYYIVYPIIWRKCLMLYIHFFFFKEILNAGDMFQMEDVRNECLKYYLLCLRDSNCLTIKEIADSRSMTKLSEKCLEYALERFLLVDVSCIIRSKFRAWVL